MKESIRFADIEKRLQRQYDADEKAMKVNYARQNELLDAVLEYRDLEYQAKSREDRMRRIIELLAGRDVYLWEAMRTVLEQVSELQVIDLQDALLHFERKVSRQAIESALSTHKETFEAKTRKRGKFVSLKR